MERLRGMNAIVRGGSSGISAAMPANSGVTRQ